jgi:uncharacterized DUF497 family protein
MRQGFEWDAAKAESNVKKHGVSFGEAATVFNDPLSLTIPDGVHSTDEQRFVTLGRSERGNLIVVCHCDRGDRIRIISARDAEKSELRHYGSSSE